MALEVRLIASNVLERNDTLSGMKRKHPIHHEEREALFEEAAHLRKVQSALLFQHG
jgi:hypothetical protein